MKEYFTLPANKKRKLLHKMKDALMAHHEILFAYIHGSFLTAPSFRDIDIAVSVDPQFLQGKGPLEVALDLGAELIFPYPIDLRVINTAPFYFQNGVARTGTLLFCRDDDAHTAMIERSSQAMLDYAFLMEESYAALAS